ncbi:hypothetical protein [Methanosphaera sp.]|uniref:hypothetical protein n=1 Tax=Methanosphaera sp. TaxID=2666342 RepID=UPI0026DFC3C6|nr:hypothetical protein [Methanosphaera sp.]MDO5821526.1 hypothetical protein [Methanosphaera sp.]
MNLEKIGGIIIILILILSIGLTVYSTTLNPTTADNSSNKSVTNITLTENQLIDELSKNDTPTNISVVNLNIKQKTGSIDIKFADSDNIYNIKSKNDANTKTDVTYTSNPDGSLDVNVNSKDAENEIILSNKYTYNINGQIVSGAVITNSTANSKINSMNFNNTLGAYVFDLNGGSINNVNVDLTLGGISIEGTPSGETTMTSTVTIGGVELDLNKDVANINSHIELGGSNIKNNPSNTEYITYTSPNYASSNDKFNLNNDIKIGGLNME